MINNHMLILVEHINHTKGMFGWKELNNILVTMI